MRLTDSDKPRKTMNGEGKMNTYGTTAKIVGAMYLAGFVVGVGGDTDPVHSWSAGSPRLASREQHAAGIRRGSLVDGRRLGRPNGVLMFPVLKQHNSERIAVGYLGFRVMDGLLITIMVLFILVQLPMAASIWMQEHLMRTPSTLSTVFQQAQLDVYNIAMTTLGISGLILCYSFYKSKLVPRLLAVWGLVGYAVILCGSVVEVLGFNLLTIHAIPGALWEVFIGVWLIVKE